MIYKIKMNSALTVFIYIIIIFVLYYAVISEAYDIFCPAKCNEFNRPECGDGKGKYYVPGKGNDKDNAHTLLDKIELLAEAENATIKWRRAFIMSCLMAVCISILILNKLPDGRELISLIISAFIICYFSYSYYYAHYNRFITSFIKENIDFLRKKLKLKRQTRIII